MKYQTQKKNAIFSFYNTPSGLFKWWDEFPKEITEKLFLKSIEHKCFYKAYTTNSTYQTDEQQIVIPNSWRWLYSIYKQSKKYNQVIFHTHSYYPPLKLYLLTLINNRFQWVITEHRLGSTATPKWKMYTRTIMRKLKLGPKYIICVSDAVEERNRKLYGQNTKRIHNGIIFNKRNSLVSTSPTPLKALYVGRLDPKKGIWNLVYAIKILVNKNTDTKIQLCIVGGGPPLDALKEYVRKNELESYIYLEGYKADPSLYYEQANFVVIPTLIKEAFSLVALEARNVETPILYANDGGLPETVEEAGTPLSGTTPEEIAYSIIEFTKNIENYTKMKVACKTGLTYFSMNRMTDEYVSFYLSLFQNYND